MSKARLVGHADPTMTMHLSFVLAPRSFADLQSRASQFRARAARPRQSGPRPLSHAEYVQNHSPLQSDYDKLKDFLGSAPGVKVIKTSGERSHVYVEAALADVEMLLGTTVNTYEYQGRQFFANATEPKLPDAFSPLVRSIGGLQNALMFRPRSLTTPGAAPYIPAEVETAYDIAPLISRGYDGSGQTIGIVTLAPFGTADVRQFESAFGLSQASITVVDSNDPPTPLCSTGGSSESTLDVEWASAIAPKAAIKAFVGSDNCDFIGPLELAVADAAVSVISVSWGACEANFSTADRDTIDALLTQAVAGNKSVFVASGDNGSSDCGANTVDFPASSPNVTAVGGTSLTISLGGSNAWSSETGWSGSGGGCSAVYSAAYQSSLSLCSGKRSVPDVSANADPGKPYTFYYNGSASSAGGTSVATAVWAGLTSDMDTGRAANSFGTEGLANSDIYTAAVETTFHDIPAGTSNGAFGTGSGYDQVTGWGSPDGNLLAAQLHVLTRPGAPTAVSATAGDGQATVTWTAPTTDGGTAINQYQVTAFDTGTSTTLAAQTVAGSPPAATLAYSGLTNGHTYTFTVAASNDGGTTSGPASTASAAVTPKVGTVMYLPNATTTAFAGSSGVFNFADASGSSAQFHFPAGISLAASGTLYVADEGNNAIRVISSGGAVTTLAPTGWSGPGAPSSGFADGTTAARFNGPQAVVVDSSETYAYVADTNNHAIRRITIATGQVDTIGGAAPSIAIASFLDGAGTTSRYSTPRGVALDGSGNLYVGDSGNHRVRKITAPSSSPVTSTLAGSGTAGYAEGTGTAAQFNTPVGVAVDGSGTVYVADNVNNRVRTVTSGGATATLAGSGPGFVDGSLSTAQFHSPVAIALGSGNAVYVTEDDSGNTDVRRLLNSTVNTVLGNPPGNTAGSQSLGAPKGVAVNTTSGQLFVSDLLGIVYRVSFGTAAPLPPTNVKAVPGNGQATVSWTAGADDGSGITGFTITPYTGATALTALAVTTGAGSTSAVVPGLTNFTSYTFTVKASSNSGASPESTASAAAIPAPTIITGRVLAGSRPVAVTTMSVACTPSTSAPCTGSALPKFVFGTDGTYTASTNPGKYDLYVGASDQNASGYNSTTPTFVDASSGASFSADVQVASASITLSGTVTTATHPAGTVNVGVRSILFPGAYDFSSSTFAAVTGAYSLSIAPGTYALFASASGYAQSLPQQVTLSSTPATQNFSLSAAPLTITGFVKNGASPVQGAQLSFNCISTDPTAACQSASFAGPTGADGSFSLYANKGKYDIFLAPGSSAGYNSLASTSVDASNASGPTLAISSALQVSAATTLLSGKVLDGSSAGISGAHVNVGFASPLASSGYDFATVTTQSDGSYSLLVAPAAYSATAAANGFLASSTASVTASGSTTSHDFVLGSAGLTVTGFVRDGSSNAIAGAQLSLACTSTSSSACDTATFAGPTGADGSFTLSANHGRYDLWVGAGDGDGFNSTSPTFVDLSGAAPGSVTVTIAAATGVLSGSVTNAANNQPIAGASVSIGIPSQVVSGSFDVKRLVTDANGAYSVAVAPGTYTLSASATGFAAAANAAFTVTASNTTTASFSLSTAPVVISGQLLNGLSAVANASLVFDCDSTAHPSCVNSSFAAKTDANGFFTLNAFAGKYDVYLPPGSPSGFNSLAPASVDASSGTIFNTVVVHASAATTTLSGTVRNASAQAVAGAAVNVGLASGLPGGTYDFRAVLADSSGHYAVALAPGTYAFYASDPTNTVMPSTTISLVVAGSALTQNFTLGATIATWVGLGTGGNWTDSTNWSPQTVPTSSTAVVIPTNGTSNYPNIQASTTIDSLTVQTSASLTITSSTTDVVLTVNSGVSNSGTITLQHTGGAAGSAAKLLITAGTLANSGTLAVSGDTNVTDVIGGSISNSGQMTLTAPLNIQLGSGLTFTNAGQLTVTGTTVLVNGGGSLSNSGTLEADGASSVITITGTTFTNLANRRLTGGTYKLQGALRVDNAYVTLLSANLTLDGTSSALTDNAGTPADALAALNSIDSSGSLTLATSRNFTSSGTFGNSGALAIGANSTFTVGSNPTAGLSGSPQFSQTGTGKLSVSLTAAGVNSKLVGSSGVGASLAGTLTIDAGGTGFVPTSGTFGIISFPGGVSGTFGTVSNTGTGSFSSILFTPTYTSTAVSLSLGGLAFTVNTTNDPSTPTSGACAAATAGQCSLREALIESNGHTNANITITVPAGTYVLANTELTATVDPTSQLSVSGVGAGSTIVDADATASDHRRILEVTSGSNVSISGLTFKRGYILTSDGSGAAINNAGTLSLSSVTITQNTAESDASGIFSTGTLTVNNSTISNNTITATYSGGGIYAAGGPVTVTNSTISGNTAYNGGGGIFVWNTCTSPVTISNSTISGNTSNSGSGGGLYVGTGCPVSVVRSTLAGNAASFGGGAFTTPGGTTSFLGSILYNPTSGDCNGTFTDAGYNLSGDATCGFSSGNNSLPSTNPLLASLGDNGGPTQTTALLAGSPAIDAGGSCTGTDQRGVSRPQGSACDIGAYEGSVPQNIISVVLSSNSTAFANCTGGNGPQGGALLGYPNATCQSGTVTVTVNGTASAVMVEATDAAPNGSGPLWTLCGTDTACTSGSTPGDEQFKLSAVDNTNANNTTTLGHGSQCDATFGCSTVTDSSRTEYLKVVGPNSSSTQASSYSTTITWTASS